MMTNEYIALVISAMVVELVNPSKYGITKYPPKARKVSYLDTRKDAMLMINFTGNIRSIMGLHIAHKHITQNVVCSPLGIILPFLTITLHSSLLTQAELLRAVGFENVEKVKEYMPRIITYLSTQVPGVEMGVLHKIIVGKIRKKPDPSLTLMDFTHPVVALHVNELIEKETMGKLKTILQETDIVPSTSLVVVSGVYFKAHWAQSFTYLGLQRFQTDMGPIEYPMIHAQITAYHIEVPSFDSELIQIPFAGNGVLSMIILLPNTVTGLPRIFNQLKLSPGTLNIALSDAIEKRMRVTLPRFTIESSFDLKDDLKHMQIFRVLNRQFSEIDGLADDTLNIDVIKQITHIEIVDGGMAPPNYDPDSSILHFTVARPFYFIINYQTEQLLTGIFVGKFGTTLRSFNSVREGNEYEKYFPTSNSTEFPQREPPSMYVKPPDYIITGDLNGKTERPGPGDEWSPPNGSSWLDPLDYSPRPKPWEREEEPTDPIPPYTLTYPPFPDEGVPAVPPHKLPAGMDYPPNGLPAQPGAHDLPEYIDEPPEDHPPPRKIPPRKTTTVPDYAKIEQKGIPTPPLDYKPLGPIEPNGSPYYSPFDEKRPPPDYPPIDEGSPPPYYPPIKDPNILRQFSQNGEENPPQFYPTNNKKQTTPPPDYSPFGEPSPPPYYAPMNGSEFHSLYLHGGTTPTPEYEDTPSSDYIYIGQETPPPDYPPLGENSPIPPPYYAPEKSQNPTKLNNARPNEFQQYSNVLRRPFNNAPGRNRPTYPVAPDNRPERYSSNKDIQYFFAGNPDRLKKPDIFGENPDDVRTMDVVMRAFKAKTVWGS